MTGATSSRPKLDSCNEDLLLEGYEGEAPNALIERLWRFGRYLFISGTHEEGMPFALYGLWGGDYALPWSHHMANENIQMTYWHCLSGGLGYAMKGFARYYTDLMDDFRTSARNLFGCRGICVSAGTTPGLGIPNQVVPVIVNWISGGGWLAQHLYDYYLYTGDVELSWRSRRAAIRG